MPDYKKLFAARVQELVNAGLIIRAVQIAPGVFAATPWAAGWAALARELVIGLGGQARITAKRGISWQAGQVVHGYLLEPGIIPDIQQAQAAISPIAPGASAYWSMGKLARLCLEYAGGGTSKTGYYCNSAERLLDGIDYGYQEVKPGEFQNCRYFDVSGYYYSILKRLPTLKLRLCGDRILWPCDTTGDAERWQEVLSIIAPHKALRNTLAGSAAGSRKATGFWKWNKITGRGEWQPLGAMPGPARTAGLLVVRTGWEWTRKEVDTDSTVYSRTDSLITQGEGTGAWVSVGLTVKEEKKWSGPADIVRLGSYSANGHETKPYADRQQAIREQGKKVYPGEIPEPCEIVRRPTPKINYGEWLKG